MLLDSTVTTRFRQGLRLTDPFFEDKFETTRKATHCWESSYSPVMQAAHPDHCDPYVVVRDGGISAIAYLVLFVTKFSLHLRQLTCGS